MDKSDDPDITYYHLTNRVRAESINSEAPTENDLKEEDTLSHPWRTFFIRLILAFIFIGLGIGLLIWSVASSSGEELHQGVSTVSPPPSKLNLARSEACYNGGTVRISSASSSNNWKRSSAELSSIWLHNHGKQQLKITLGNRSEAANEKWVADLYYLQYGTYILMPNGTGKSSAQKCIVDWTMNYTSFINQLDTSDLVQRNSSTLLDLYTGHFQKKR